MTSFIEPTWATATTGAISLIFASWVLSLKPYISSGVSPVYDVATMRSGLAAASFSRLISPYALPTTSVSERSRPSNIESSAGSIQVKIATGVTPKFHSAAAASPYAAIRVGVWSSSTVWPRSSV